MLAISLVSFSMFQSYKSFFRTTLHYALYTKDTEKHTPHVLATAQEVSVQKKIVFLPLVSYKTGDTVTRKYEGEEKLHTLISALCVTVWMEMLIFPSSLLDSLEVMVGNYCWFGIIWVMLCSRRI